MDVKPGDWIASLTSAERKEVSVERGLYAYFPDALALVARHSFRSNQKHNPRQPLHWSREKSSDHGDCIGRHHLAVSADRDALDDGQPEIVCRAWRALADLQLWAEEQVRKQREAPMTATEALSPPSWWKKIDNCPCDWCKRDALR